MRAFHEDFSASQHFTLEVYSEILEVPQPRYSM
jgi:hypothetical protein